jgi:hypothetical protein
MRRPWLMLCLGLAAAAAAYALAYYSRFALSRTNPTGHPAELAWLQREFNLTRGEFERIAQLHQAYLPDCVAMCQRVDAINRRLRGLLAATNQVTPEIQQALADAARVRTDCQARMLGHFYAVSRSMPPEQGKRYLEWMQSQTLLPTFHSAAELGPASAAHERDHH